MAQRRATAHPLREPTARELRVVEREWPLIAAEMALVEALARLASEPVHRWLWRRQHQPWPVAEVWSVDCEVCEESAGPFASEGLAVHAAGGHDDRYHAGRPTATTLPPVGPLVLGLGGAA
jgi:Family of unknown function (DUF6284)